MDRKRPAYRSVMGVVGKYQELKRRSTKLLTMRRMSVTVGSLRAAGALQAVNAGPWASAAINLVTRHGFLLATLAFCAYFLVAIILETGYVLLTEDQLFEYWTVALYLASALICLLGPRVFPGAAPLTRYWLMGWAVLFLLVALEEISWGQRILGLNTPDFLVSHNLQKETNIHNLDSEGVNRLFASFVFAVAIALPSLALLSKRFNSLVRRFGVPLPPWNLVVPFSLAFAFFVPAWIASAPETEVLTGLVLLWLTFVVVAKWKGSEAAFPRINAFHLMAGVVGIVAIQTVLSVFEGNLGHRSHPSEIKEFLFSVGFLGFSLGVALPGLGKAMARFRLA